LSPCIHNHTIEHLQPFITVMLCHKSPLRSVPPRLIDERTLQTTTLCGFDNRSADVPPTSHT
jgi:hypothetical protein